MTLDSHACWLLTVSSLPGSHACVFLLRLQASAVEAAVETAAKGDEQCAALLHTSLAPLINKVRPRLLELVNIFLEQIM